MVDRSAPSGGTTTQGPARQLGTSWNTLWTQVQLLLTRAANDSVRFENVQLWGVDENFWRHRDPRRRCPKELTGMVDLTRGPHPSASLLDLVPGRSGKAYRDWLDARVEEFEYSPRWGPSVAGLGASPLSARWWAWGPVMMCSGATLLTLPQPRVLGTRRKEQSEMLRKIRAKLVLQLRADGLSGRAIAASQGMSRKSITALLDAADAAEIGWDEVVMTLVEIPQLCSPKFPSLGRSVA